MPAFYHRRGEGRRLGLDAACAGRDNRPGEEGNVGEYADEARCDGQLFVIAGISRVSVRVATALTARGGRVVLVFRDDPQALADLLPEGTQTYQGHHLQAVFDKLELDEARCFLALADDDLENLGAAIAAHASDGGVPMVLSVFDVTMADLLEANLGVRRGFSPAGIAAPAFVAAALGADVIETMRLGEALVPICELTVEPGSPLDGATAAELKASFGCALVAHAPPGGAWEPAAGDRHRLSAGERVVIGGLSPKVLRTARANSWGQAERRPRERSRTPRAPRLPRDRTLGTSLLPAAAWGSAALLVVTMVVFGLALHLNPVDALFSAVSTAFGSPVLPESRAWLKIFAVGAMIAGGALVGVLFAYLAAVATAERLEQRMGRRAGKLHGHVVVAGLGTVGYEVERLLFELDIRSVVIERSPDHRFSSTVGERSPVLTGDVRLAETLERAGTRGARCLLACTTDDLANVESCLQARRLQPEIRTVARIFDPAWADRAREAFGIDRALSTSEIAARAFVGAALDERSLRPFAVGGLPYLALRYTVARGLAAGAVQDWRMRGLRILAYLGADGEVRSPDALASDLIPGDRIVVAGPEAVVREEVLAAAP